MVLGATTPSATSRWGRGRAAFPTTRTSRPLEGQDAVEPDDLDGYGVTAVTGVTGVPGVPGVPGVTGVTGVPGGGWGLTQADSAGFERWIAYQAHAEGLAVFEKNDAPNARRDEPLFDGVITEECNAYSDPCAGAGGDWAGYLAAHKAVLNGAYARDGESTAKFCAADRRWGIWGALFGVGLGGERPDAVCWTPTTASRWLICRPVVQSAIEP